MPLYEMVVIMRNMKRPELAACMKRTGELLLNNGVVIRMIETLGINTELPYKMTANGKANTSGSYALYRFHGRSDLPEFLKTELNRDVDVVRSNVVNAPTPLSTECTLEEELQIPMKRPSVLKLMKTGKRTIKENPIKAKISGPF